MPETLLLNADSEGLTQAGILLSEGKLVAFPTETVYGLGADARNDTAVARVFEAKGRPSFNPLIVHVADRDAAEKIAVFNQDADRLASAFWPGPLTLVLPLRSGAGISPLVTAGLDTIAVRVPAHPVAERLLQESGLPLAAPSANISGRVSPSRAQHVLDGLDGRIAAVIDGGDCSVGLESTIVRLKDGAVLLRPGGLPLEALQECVSVSTEDLASPKRPTAPGQLASHYAPKAPMRLDATGADEGEVLLGFGPGVPDATMNLSPSGDLVEAAANLFHYLRELDHLGRPIAVSPIPNTGLGRAINDRLRRAAAPRD